MKLETALTAADGNALLKPSDGWSERMSAPLSCPRCRTRIKGDIFTVGSTGYPVRCPACSAQFPSRDGCVDFVAGAGEEQRFFDAQYRSPAVRAPAERVDFDSLERFWSDPAWPERGRLWRQLGDLSGKTVLLVGNGISRPELLFVKHGARVIFSDLSIESAVRMRTGLDFGELTGNIVFHAIDALRLPLADRSVDLVYGWSFVHHLPDADAFFAEAARVLRPGGRCCLFDHAYSPVWQIAKGTVLYPLMKLTHSTRGISPADRVATAKGGFTLAEAERMRVRHGFSRVVFDRFGLIYWLFKRGTEKLLPRWPWLNRARRAPVPWLYGLDDRLAARSRWYRDNTTALVWVYEK